MIVPFSAEHADAAADLHVSSLTGLLTALGPAAARAFYRGAARSGRLVGVADVESGRLRGFAVGALDPSALRSGALRAAPWATLSALALATLRRPRLAAWLIAGGPATAEPELTYIAVAPEDRGRGVGGALVDAFVAALGAAGARTCLLSVDAGNASAEALYAARGFVPVDEVAEFGLRRRRLRRSA